MPPKLSTPQTKENINYPKEVESISEHQFPYKVFVTAFALRLLFIVASPSSEFLQNRIELVTPVTSFISIKEGVFLIENGIPPYIGGVLRQSPLLLPIFSYLVNLSEPMIQLFYTFLDIFLGFLLWKMAIKYYPLRYTFTIQDPKYDFDSPADDPIKEPKIITFGKETTGKMAFEPWLVPTIYLLNPLSILSCFSLSTIIFNNIYITGALIASLNGSLVISSFFLALATHLSFYPIALLPPICLLSCRENQNFKKGKLLISVISYTFWISAFGVASTLIAGSNYHFTSSFGSIIFFDDLTPNLGLFWYFFIEMFDQFRSYFIMALQFFNFALLGPLCYRLRDHSMLVIFLQLATNCTFKSYPSLGDFNFYISFLPMFSAVFIHMNRRVVISLLILFGLGLSPILWEGWIGTRTANANFFYAVTLVYSIGQTLLITDVLQAFLKFDFFTRHPKLVEKSVIFQ